MKKRLEATTSSGKTKFLEIEAKNEYLITRWGYVDGKVQETKEKCEAKNIGKKNEITAKEQAVIRLKRKIKKKMDEGYIIPGGTIIIEKKPDLMALQKYFAPCKPIAKSPKDALNEKYLAERKYNGVNIIMNKDKNGNPHIYTRRVDDITSQLYQLDEIKRIFDDMKDESMLLIELIFVDNNDVEVPENLRALINKRRSAEAVKERYDEMNKEGKLVPIIFDVMFWDGNFVGDMNFVDRRDILIQTFVSHEVPYYTVFTQHEINEGKKNGWEGFILRKKDGKIAYTMNGKAKRFGSWKWKYEITDDFIVVDAEYGRGKHDKYFAKFKLAQYDKDGHFVDCGYCGPGNLKVEELKELYADRKSVGGVYRIEPYMVIEVLFRARSSGGVKLEFPVFKRIRDDKKPTECVYNGI